MGRGAGGPAGTGKTGRRRRVGRAHTSLGASSQLSPPAVPFIPPPASPCLALLTVSTSFRRDSDGEGGARGGSNSSTPAGATHTGPRSPDSSSHTPIALSTGYPHGQSADTPRTPGDEVRKSHGHRSRVQRAMHFLRDDGWWAVPLVVLLALAYVDASDGDVFGVPPSAVEAAGTPWARAVRASVVPEPAACDLARFKETCAIPCTAALLRVAEAAVAGAEEARSQRRSHIHSRVALLSTFFRSPLSLSEPVASPLAEALAGLGSSLSWLTFLTTLLCPSVRSGHCSSPGRTTTTMTCS